MEHTGKFIISYCGYYRPYKRGVVGGNFPVFFAPVAGSCWWRYGELLVALRGVVGGKGMRNALRFKRLQGQKIAISFIISIKIKPRGRNG